MRFRRLSYVVGVIAVAVLAIAGFAAFGTPDATTDEVQAEAAAASVGHTAGAYAGLTFALLSSDGDSTVIVGTAVAEEPTQGGDSEPTSDIARSTEGAEEDGSEGTIASPSSGWLSEVEVRALVSLYFEPTDVNKAVRIAWCESKFDPNITNLKTGGVGLFSHLPRYWAERASNAGFPDADPTNPEAATAAAAWEVYNGAGWEIFNCD